MVTQSEFRATILKLLAFCKANDWAGYDPYDALNSKVLKAFPFFNSRIPRIVLTQLLKRSPMNLRPLLGIPRLQNPKAIALFLSAFVRLAKTGGFEVDQLIPSMVNRLIALRSSGTSYWCWGYSFPWQTRTITVPANAPNLVCTCFAADALLNAYEALSDRRCLSMAVSAADYIVSELYWSGDGPAAGFSYPQPSIQTEVHNANLLAAALLSRVYRHTGDPKYLLPALKAARYAVTKQNAEGSWYYGETNPQRWIDNFHTGYNLCALRSIARSLGTTEFDPCIRNGFEFYRTHFFRKDGAAKYFHTRTYPIDIHAVAQAIITLVELGDLDPDNIRLAHRVLRWAIDHMWDDRGFFYYRVLRICTIRTPYMRWSEAWMFLAMSILFGESSAAVAMKDAQREISSACIEGW